MFPYVWYHFKAFCNTPISFKLPFVIKIFVLSILEWPFYTGFTVLFLVCTLICLSTSCANCHCLDLPAARTCMGPELQCLLKVKQDLTFEISTCYIKCKINCHDQCGVCGQRYHCIFRKIKTILILKLHSL